MRNTKKKRLEAKGWRVGTAEDFLDLTPEETSFIELKLRLSESLRTRRKRKKLSQTALAKLINSSQSRVAKMEGGDPSVSVDLLIRSLLALGASEKDIASAMSPSGRPASS